MLPQEQTFVETDYHADLCDLAHQWGKQDALERIDMRGSAYFLICGAAWNAYNDGYAVGLQLRKLVASPEEMSELEFMDYVLETLRAGREPIVRLTDEQLAEIEDERPGENFSEHPYLW